MALLSGVLNTMTRRSWARLIFLSLVGGLVTFSPLGIVVDTVVLAVAYTLLLTWVRSDDGTARHVSVLQRTEATRAPR